MSLPSAFMYYGMKYIGQSECKGSSKEDTTRFKAHFGTSPEVCAYIWTFLSARLPNGAHFFHLLWGLLLMKVYATESVLCGMVKCHEKTFCKWSHNVVKGLATLKSQFVSFIVILYYILFFYNNN